MYVLGALGGEMENDTLKTTRLKTQIQEIAEVLRDVTFQFVFCEIAITLNEIFFQSFFLWKGKTTVRKPKCAVFDLTLFWKLAKTYQGDGVFVPWLAANSNICKQTRNSNHS